jgi:glycosyltransferase involved in cell wall biosynthesis
MESEARPSLSIILLTKNRARYLRRSLQSLIREMDLEWPDTEVIVIDGGSDDGTVELLKSYASRIDLWVSEPDSGVAEAFNKGLRLARGTIIRALGDDDEVVPGGLARMMEYLAEHPECDAVTGHNQVYIEDTVGNLMPYPQKKFIGDVSVEDLRAFPHYGIFIPECTFFRREVLAKYGGYDESFRYWGYLDLFFRLVRAGVRIRVIPEQILITYQTPASDSIRANGNHRWNYEWNAVQKRHSTLYWRIWHDAGGEITSKSLLKWIFRKACLTCFGATPRPLLARLTRRFRGSST